MRKATALGAALVLLVLFSLQDTFGQGTVFTYQGRLSQNGGPFTGTAEIAPTLWDAASGGNPVGTNNPVTLLVMVSNGLFNASLDFGSSPFTAGAARWLQLGVRTMLGPFTILSPLQPLTATPYAITAGYVTTAGTATSFSGPLAGNVTGTQGGDGGIERGRPNGGGCRQRGQRSQRGNERQHGEHDCEAGCERQLLGWRGHGHQRQWERGEPDRTQRQQPGQRHSGARQAERDHKQPVGFGDVAIPGRPGFGGSTNPPTSGTNGMVLIPGGSFTMGNSIGDSDITDAATVTPNVSAFYMDANLVTWSQWQGVYAYATNHGYVLNAGAGKGTNHPVQMVGWSDCVKWCNARSQQAGKTPVYYTDAGLTRVYTNLEVTVYVNWTAKGYRLPTEAEWEKAARGGLSGLRFPWGNLISQTNANYYGNTSSSYDLGPNGYNPIGSVGGTSPATSPVGSFAPNGYGLYDMAGNVWQWCWDWYGTPYAGGTDPRGVASGSFRVIRGGSWGDLAIRCRAAFRFYDYIPPFRSIIMGFRSVLPPGQ